MAECQRLDRFLCRARLVRTRGRAQTLVRDGRMRVNGRVVARPARQVMPGDILVFALRGRVRVLRILALPDRRGPAGEARACYAEIAPGRGAGGVDEPTGRGLGQERRGGA